MNETEKQRTKIQLKEKEQSDKTPFQQLMIPDVRKSGLKRENVFEKEEVTLKPVTKRYTEEEQNKLDDDKEALDALDLEDNEYDYEAGFERNFDREFYEGYEDKFQLSYLDYYNLNKKD